MKDKKRILKVKEKLAKIHPFYPAIVEFGMVIFVLIIGHIQFGSYFITSVSMKPEPPLFEKICWRVFDFDWIFQDSPLSLISLLFILTFVILPALIIKRKIVQSAITPLTFRQFIRAFETYFVILTGTIICYFGIPIFIFVLISVISS